MTLFPYLNQGPTFAYYDEKYIQSEVKRNWWSYILFINNIYPFQEDQGLYWLYFTANELQFYIFVLAPSLYFY